MIKSVQDTIFGTVFGAIARDWGIGLEACSSGTINCSGRRYLLIRGLACHRRGSVIDDQDLRTSQSSIDRHLYRHEGVKCLREEESEIDVRRFWGLL